MDFKQSKSFIYHNARPLDLARWKYHFENGSKEDVLIVLSTYKNKDGGFAHALEPDSWNENSSPLQTWVATRLIEEIDLSDKKHLIITGILKYLESSHEFNGHLWNGLNTVQSNNDYPHAPWWSYTKKDETQYNPSASLIGFILKYAEKHSDLYQKGIELLNEAIQYFKESIPLESMHETACFVELYQYLKESENEDLVNMHEFKLLLTTQMKKLISNDIDTWASNYACKPCLFIKNQASDFYQAFKDLCDQECQFIIKNQNLDGTWNITWNWESYPKEWVISQNWWKSDMIIKNLLFLKAMNKALF